MNTVETPFLLRQIDCLCHHYIVSVNNFSWNKPNTLFPSLLLIVWTQKQRFLHHSIWSNARNAVSNIFHIRIIQASCHNPFLPFCMDVMTVFPVSCTDDLTICLEFSFIIVTFSCYFSCFLIIHSLFCTDPS